MNAARVAFGQDRTFRPGDLLAVVGGFRHNPHVTFTRAQRPGSLVLAAAASVLLVLGQLPAGLALGAGAILVAWLPSRNPAQETLDE